MARGQQAVRKLTLVMTDRTGNLPSSPGIFHDHGALERCRALLRTGGKLLGPERRRAGVQHVQSVLGVSERRACRTLGQPRSTQRKVRAVSVDEAALTDAVVSLAAEYGRYG